MTRQLIASWAALALACAPILGAQKPGRDNRAAIRAGDIKHDLFEMASDAFRGREAGTLDEMRASVWVADMARRAGLQPAGELGSYFQWWGLRRNRVASSSSIVVGDQTMSLWTEAIVSGVTDAKAQGPVMWVGAATTQELDAMDVKGRVVAANVITPANAPGANVSLRAWRYARLAVAQRGTALVQRGAAAVILVADSTVDSVWDFQGAVSGRGTYGLDSAGANQRPRATAPVIVVRPALADALRRAGTMATIDIRSESFVYPSVNVVGKVIGTDPQLRNEYVLFSSHQDHDGVRSAVNGDSIWNGADDNATGSVSLLAIARAFAKKPGKRSALFVWHGAEERGLLGSRWHAEHPMVPKEQIVAVLNAEMMGRNSPDSATLMGVQPPHRNSTALVNMALQANTETAKFLLDSLWDRPTHPEGWYFRSDHLPYARAGIPAVMYSSNLHPDYHTPRDEAATIDIAKLTKMTLWIYRTGWLVANAKERPRVDPGFKLER